MKQGQGSIEYLLLIAAAIVVVGVVIAFIISTIGPVQETGSQQTYDYTCKTLNTNSFLCGCYECNSAKGGYSPELAITVNANKTDCDALSAYKNDSLLLGSKCQGW
jgi:uncharacterized protein (UPF0333 family)